MDDLSDMTNGLLDNVCGQIGVTITSGNPGDTIGPPADKE